MKKVISIILASLMVFAMPFSASAASKDMGTVNLSIIYGSVWLYDQKDASLNTLEAMAELGISSKSVHTGVYDYDLDKDGHYDLMYVYEESDSDYGSYSKNSNTNLTGQWDYTVPQKVKDNLIANDKDYCSRFLIEFDDSCPKGGKHNWVQGIQKATFGKDGCTYAKCSKCNKKEVGFPILKVSASIAKTEYSYDGKAKKPKINVSTADGPLGKEYYKVEYSNNVNPGTATAKVTLIGDYFEGTKTFSFTIKKSSVKITNPIKVKGKTVIIKYSKLKKKNQKIKRTAAISVKGAKGALTFKKSKGSKKITVAKSGKITVKKGLKKGTYKVKIKVKAAGNSEYKSATKTATVKIKVQ